MSQENFRNMSLNAIRTVEFKSVYPDKNNHTIDAVRYALEDEITKKKARVIKRSELDL